jgi:hypothetical protein
VPDSREQEEREIDGVCFRERKGLLEREMAWLCDDLAAAALGFSRVQRAAQDRCVVVKGESTDRVTREPIKTKQIARGQHTASLRDLTCLSLQTFGRQGHDISPALQHGLINATKIFKLSF